MNTLRRHWYNLGLVVAVAAIAWACFGNLGTVQLVLLLNFVALIIHQFEEYGWPGGEAWITNEVMQAGGDPPDRWPLNQNNAFVINVPMAWSFYLVPVFFPNVVWLGLAQTLFGFGQLMFHGVLTTKKMKWPYNPGLAAVVLGHVPIGIWYLYEVYKRHMITGWDWLFAIACLGSFMAVGMKVVGYGWLASKDSPYPFAPEEMERFGRRRHLARLGRPVP